MSKKLRNLCVSLGRPRWHGIGQSTALFGCSVARYWLPKHALLPIPIRTIAACPGLRRDSLTICYRIMVFFFVILLGGGLSASLHAAVDGGGSSPLPTKAKGKTAAHLATRAAQQAFFAMDAARIEAAMDASAAPEGVATDKEADLIAFLSKQKALGADFNAYVHLAPMLHHAVRASMNETAVWLMRNGANPLLPIQGEVDTDAVAVAITVGNWDAFDALLSQPLLQRLTAEQLAVRYWPVASKSVQATQALVQRRFPLPRFAVVSDIATKRLIDNLCLAQLDAALEALSAEPASEPVVMPLDAREKKALLLPCSDSRFMSTWVPSDAAVGSVPPTPQQWRQLQDRLKVPMMPFAMRHVRSAVQLKALDQAGVRMDWNNRVAVGQLILNLSQQVETQPFLITWLRQQSAAPLREQLQDVAVFQQWMRAIPNWSVADVAWALEQVDTAQLSENMAQVLQSWRYASTTRSNAKDAQGRLQRWSALTQRLSVQEKSIPVPGLAYELPSALWSAWLERGFRIPDEEALDALVRQTSTQGREQVFVALQKYQPTTTPKLLNWLVAPLSVGPTSDPVAQNRSASWYYSDDASKAVQFLYSKGLRVAQPRWLAAQFVGADAQKAIAFELQHGLVKRPPPELRQQLIVVNELKCTPTVSPAMRKSLASKPLTERGYSSQEVFDVLQPVAQPGNAACLWIAVGGEFGGRKFIDDENFFTGINRLTPCADSQRTAFIWDEAQGQWVALELNGALSSHWQTVSLRHGSAVALMTDSVDLGGCGVSARALFEVQPAHTDIKHAIKPLPSTSPIQYAFDLQCPARAMTSCFSDVSGSVQDTNLLLSQEERGISSAMAQFAERYLVAEKKAFIAAVLALDRSTLKAMQAQGVFPTWGAQAIEQVSTSALPVPDKRRRMAWLLAQPRFITPVDAAVFAQMVQWLPLEDWSPILRTLRCQMPYTLGLLQEALRAQTPLSTKNTVLEQRIATAWADKRCDHAVQ